MLFTFLKFDLVKTYFNPGECDTRFYAYRFFYALNIIMYGAGIIILIFKYVGINYTYIFEVSSQGQISPWSMVIFSQWMSLGFFLCKYINLLFYDQISTLMLRMILMTGFTVLILLVPIRKLKTMK